MNNKPIIVGIAGASGSGKSKLATNLGQYLQENTSDAVVQILKEDSYYRDQSDLEFEQRELTNYDHPDAFEHDLLIQHVRLFLQGKSFEAPKYDYTVHNRAAQTQLFEPGRILILEGILLLHDAELRRLLDLSVFVDVPLEICLIRRIRRDVESRMRDVGSILDQFENAVRPMYFEFIVPTKSKADAVVTGGGENLEAIQKIANQLMSKMNISTS